MTRKITRREMRKVLATAGTGTLALGLYTWRVERILAGHTHGGQCKPPFLPPPLVPVANKRYISGKIELSGNRNMYISRGVGHLLRVRFNARPEVAVFKLQRAV